MYFQYILSLLFSRELTRSGFDTFMTKCKDTFNIRVPIKPKFLRSKQSLFTNKKISKAVMGRTRLSFLRTRSNGDKGSYNKQWKYWASLVRKTKQNYCNNLDRRKVADDKSYWKYIIPLFSDKNSNSNKVMLMEKNFNSRKEWWCCENF